jgi:CubicO group peptidase (beta-lactamase class C family)
MNKAQLSKIDGLLQKAIDTRHIPGASVLVRQNGDEIFGANIGYADIESKYPIKDDTIYRLFSLSKPITGAAAMLLLQDGEIDLHDPVSKYLPGFANQQVCDETSGGIDEAVARYMKQMATGAAEEPKPAARVQASREVRIYDLLRMTSGVPYPLPVFESGRQAAAVFAEIGQGIGTVEFADKLGKCDLMFQPGSHWMYGASADIMGAIAEVASGKRFGEFLHERLFEPLGMDDTAFYVPREKQARLAKTYEETGGEMKLYAPEDASGLGAWMADMDNPLALEAGGSGLFSTIGDYARFAQMLLNGGSFEGKQILFPKIVEFFTSGQLNAAQRQNMEDLWQDALSGFNYGNFMRVMENPGRATSVSSPGEYGWDGALGCYWANAPRENLSILLMLQRNNSGTIPLTRRIRNVVFSAL